MGLADLIPQLQQALIEEYKKDLPDPEIHQVKEEDMHLYVPDFNRTTQNSGEVDLEELSRQAKQAINGSKRTLKQNGVSLSDFALIDKTTDASARLSATSAIEEELPPVLENNQDKTQETVDISLD